MQGLSKAALFVALIAAAGSAFAQTPDPAPAPPPPPPPPPGAYPYPYPQQPYPYPYPPPPPPGYYYPAPYPPPAPPPPAEMPYEDGQQVPAGYRIESRVRRGAVIAGTVMFATTYGINLLVASFAESDEANWLYVPGVGTWPLLGDACDRDSGEDSGCEFLILHSLTHTLGLGLLIYGIAAPKKVLVRDASVTLVPISVAGGGGLGLSGSF